MYTHVCINKSIHLSSENPIRDSYSFYKAYAITPKTKYKQIAPEKKKSNFRDSLSNRSN